MPTYEYICKSCGENIEIFQSFSDKPLKKHKACGGELKKVFHARGIVFKGSGFYATDAKPAASSSGSTGEKKADSPAAKNPAKPAKEKAAAATD